MTGRTRRQSDDQLATGSNVQQRRSAVAKTGTLLVAGHTNQVRFVSAGHLIEHDFLQLGRQQRTHWSCTKRPGRGGRLPANVSPADGGQRFGRPIQRTLHMSRRIECGVAHIKAKLAVADTSAGRGHIEGGRQSVSGKTGRSNTYVELYWFGQANERHIVAASVQPDAFGRRQQFVRRVAQVQIGASDHHGVQMRSAGVT